MNLFRHTLLIYLCLGLAAVPVSASEAVPASTGATLSTGFPLAPLTMTLEDCLAIALRENRSVNQSRARVKSARARRSQIVATQLPTANAQIQNSRYNQAPSSSAKDTQDVHRIVVAETFQPFGRFRSQKQAAQATIVAADADVSRAEIEAAFQVTRAFYDLILAEQLRKVASEAVDQIARHRDNTQMLVSAGSAPKFDLIRAEVQLANAQPPLIRATHAISNAVADLLSLIGLEPTANPRFDGSLPETMPADIPLNEQEALQTALVTRPDLKSAQATLRASQHSLAASRKALQPSVQLSQTFEENRGIRAPLGNYKTQRLTQVGLVFPFLDSGLSRAQTQEAAANLEQSRLGHDNVLSALHVEVRKAISGLKESFEVLLSQEKNVEQAREALSIAETAYKTGSKTALDVIDAQLALTQARTLRYQALRDRAVALAQYEKALGLMPGTFLLQGTEANP